MLYWNRQIVARRVFGRKPFDYKGILLVQRPFRVRFTAIQKGAAAVA
jgi:hypothetical protein